MTAPYPPDQTPSSSRISPPSSITPTRRNQPGHTPGQPMHSAADAHRYAQDEYASPTAYTSSHGNVFLATSQQGMTGQDSYHFGGGSSGPSSAEQSFDENYGFSYNDFQPQAQQGFPMLSAPAPGMANGIGLAHINLAPPQDATMQDDERTPVISDTQHRIEFPTRSRNSTGSTAHPSQDSGPGQQHLQSPFNLQQQQRIEQFQTPPFNHPAINIDFSASASASTITTASLHTPLQYGDPALSIFRPSFSQMQSPQYGYAHMGQTQQSEQYGQVSPFSNSTYPYMPSQPVPDDVASGLSANSPYYSAPHPDLSPTASFSTAQSRQPSPEASMGSNSITTSAALARSQSLSAMSSVSRFAKPKPKLSHEDKRKICELAASKTALRQEDIAQMFGVDRSTISKIVQSSNRWMMPPNEVVEPQPKAPKPVGGRFPAIEDRMHAWMDWMFGQGQDVRDSLAKDKAKEIAKELGFKEDRFKASAKWLDKFKERRKAMGKPVSTIGTLHNPFYNSQQVWPPLTGSSSVHQLHSNHAMSGPPVMINRSESQATLLSSTDSSSQEDYSQPPYAYGYSSTAVLTQSTPNLPLMRTSPLNVTVPPLPPQHLQNITRHRSQSSPHRPQLGVNLEAGTDAPSSGKATRHSRPLSISLSRQNSYHGATSPSPRRPAPLSRANSAQTVSRNRPRSLAASAFGITPINTEEGYVGSPLASPAMSAALSSGPQSAVLHSRSRSDVSLAPLGHSMGGMTISPDMSDSGEISAGHDGVHQLTPVTPFTPAHLPGGYQGGYAGMKGGTAPLPVSTSGVFHSQDYSNLPDDQIYAPGHFAAQQGQGRQSHPAYGYTMTPGHGQPPPIQGQQEYLMMHH